MKLLLGAFGIGAAGVGGAAIVNDLSNKKAEADVAAALEAGNDPSESDSPSAGEPVFPERDNNLPQILVQQVPRETLTTPEAKELRTFQRDPQLDALLSLTEKSLDPRYQAVIGQQNLERTMAARQQVADLNLRAQDQVNRRLIEQENVRAWKEAFKAQTQANTAMALGTAQAISNAMTPNTQFMGAITNAMKAASDASGLQRS